MGLPPLPRRTHAGPCLPRHADFLTNATRLLRAPVLPVSAACCYLPVWILRERLPVRAARFPNHTHSSAFFLPCCQQTLPLPYHWLQFAALSRLVRILARRLVCVAFVYAAGTGWFRYVLPTCTLLLLPLPPSPFLAALVAFTHTTCLRADRTFADGLRALPSCTPRACVGVYTGIVLPAPLICLAAYTHITCAEQPRFVPTVDSPLPPGFFVTVLVSTFATRVGLPVGILVSGRFTR